MLLQTWGDRFGFSDQIPGIPKTMGDELAVASEDVAIASFDEFIAAKTKELAVLNKEIETKLVELSRLSK